MATKQTKVFLGGVLLPVPPEKITRSIKNQNKTLTTMSGQEINLVRPAGLTEIVLSKVLLPNTAYDFMEATEDGSKMGAQYYLDFLEGYKKSGEAITFDDNDSTDGLCNDGDAHAYMVTVEDYKITRSPDLGDDIEVEIKLKQYVEYGLKSVPVDNTKKTKKKSRTEKTTETTAYTVQKGDTLWAIAKKFYGDGSLYPYLAYINNISNPNIIHTGQVLKIGPKSEALAYKPTAKTTGTSTKTSDTVQKTEEVKTSDTTKVLGLGGGSIKDRVLADADVVISITKPLDVLSPSGLAFYKDQQKLKIPAGSEKVITPTKIDIKPVNGGAISVNPK